MTSTITNDPSITNQTDNEVKPTSEINDTEPTTPIDQIDRDAIDALSLEQLEDEIKKTQAVQANLSQEQQESLNTMESRLEELRRPFVEKLNTLSKSLQYLPYDSTADLEELINKAGKKDTPIAQSLLKRLQAEINHKNRPLH